MRVVTPCGGRCAWLGSFPRAAPYGPLVITRWLTGRPQRRSTQPRPDATPVRPRRRGLAASVTVLTAAAVFPVGLATVLAPPAAAATGSTTYALEQAGAYQLALTPDGTAYITHYSADPNGTISRVTDDGVVTDTVTSVSKYALGIVAARDGTVYSAQQSDSTISRIAPDGTVEAAWVTLPTNPHPYALTIDPAGNLYTANANRRTVSKVTPAGVPTDPWGSEPSVPTGIAADPLGGVMTTNDDGSVSRFAPDGSRTVVRGPQATKYVVGIAFASDGTAYVVDSDKTVTRIPHGGAPQTAWATIPGAPLGIAVDGLGNVYVSYPDAIAKIRPDRTMDEDWATFPDRTFPVYLAASGDGSRVWSVSMKGIIRVAEFFPPAAVEDLGVTAGNRSLQVSFGAPSDDGGSAVTGYQVSTDGGTTWASLATTAAGGRLTAPLSTTSAGGP